MDKFSAKLMFIVFVGCLSVKALAAGSSSSHENGAGRASRRTGNTIDDCLQKDSISCVQIQMFRNARDFFNKPSLEVFVGAELLKTPEQPGTSRNFATSPEIVEQQLGSTESVVKKAEVLEKYFIDEAKNFFERRSLKWNMDSLARSVFNAAPGRWKTMATDLFEARGKKKVFKLLMPFLLGLKLKFATFMGLVFLGVVVLAKKAMVMSLLSIAISSFFLIKKLFSGHQPQPYGHGQGWQSHSDSGLVEYAASSFPEAQQLAYGAQKPIA